MERRLIAAQACIDRFAGLPYAPGQRDCTVMARHCLHKLGLKVGIAKGVRYSSEIGGIKALKGLGFKDLIEAVDSLGLPRIAPAAALAGDLVALPTESPLGSLAVNVGNGRLLAYGEDFAGATIIGDVKDFVCAWRTI